MNIILIPIVVVLLDQFSKVFVKNHWIDNNLFFSKINIFGEYVRFIFIENPGIAFGIDTSKYHIFITLLTLISVVIISVYYYRCIVTRHYERYCLSFILGGAIGNLLDRIFVLIPQMNYSGVIDFIDVGFNNFRWYTFNIADASITIGIFVYLYQTYFLKET
mgnify:CR=1 FL=1